MAVRSDEDTLVVSFVLPPFVIPAVTPKAHELPHQAPSMLNYWSSNFQQCQNLVSELFGTLFKFRTFFFSFSALLEYNQFSIRNYLSEKLSCAH